MKIPPQDNEPAPGGQASPASEAQKHHEVASILCENGFSPDRAEEFWSACDRIKEVEELIADAIAWAFKDNTAEVYGENGEQEGAAEAGRVPPVHEHAPDFDVPPPSGQKDTVAADPETVYEDVDPDHPESVADDLDPEEEQDNFPIGELALFKRLLRPVQDWMRQLDMPALLPVACALIALSASLGRGLRVRNNKGRTFPNLFALLGADSGTGKTLVYNEACRPLEELQYALDEAFEEETKDLRASLGLIKNEINAILYNHLKAERKGEKLASDEEKAARAKLRELYKEQEQIEDRMARPPCVWTSDFTSEALGARLANSDECVAVLSDEGGICIYNLEGRYCEGDMTDDILLCKCFSVNAHAVDRIGRGRITLKLPCVALLLLIQPDLLNRVFRNERLLLGGFLARCLCADTKLQMREEDESEEDVTFDEVIAAEWNRLLKGLYAKYHQAQKPYDLGVTPAVRVLSHKLHNSIVRKVKGRLSDVKSFAARWREIAWKVAMVLHAALYGTDSELHPLEPVTFEAATSIVRYFASLQLDVLQALRMDMLHKTHERLQELFLQNDNEPMRVRDLEKTHGLEREAIAACVKAHPKIYRLTKVKPAHGGSVSTLVFLRT